MPTGVLLLNLGGPDSQAAVRPFLLNLFSDRDIIRLGPAFLQRPIASIIAATRSGKTKAAYRLIGGKSPINELTFAQASALEAALNGGGAGIRETRYRVFVGMRYWHPLIEETLEQIVREGITRLAVITLYPQYSVATTGSSLARLNQVIAGRGIQTVTVDSWYADERYIDALVEKIRDGLSSFGADAPNVHVLFSAHSLPKKFIEEGDPYVAHTEATIANITGRISIEWSLSYQSKSGPVAWLEPSTDDMIKDLAGRGVKNLLVVPISFVSDHIETLYEIDMLYRDMAAALGMVLKRTESLNTSPQFIDALRHLVEEATRRAGWQTSQS